MLAISIEDVWKQYALGKIGHGTLSADLQSLFARIFGKDDPNARFDAKANGARIGGTTFSALRGVTLDIAQGEVVGIIGRNGAGKSTLLKLLSRVTTPTHGVIKVRGRLASLLEVGTGFHPELSGRENIYLNGAILGMRRAEVQKRFDEIVEFSGVQDFIDTPVKRYSSGMYVRLAFAVAAHLEPDILIVDEVLAVGDAEFQKKCIGKMNEVSKRGGRTVLFVSHNMSSIELLCSRTIWMDEGRVAHDGPTGETIVRYLDALSAGNLRTRDDSLIFETVAIRDSTGATAEKIVSGQPFAVALRFKVQRRLESPLIKLAFFDQGSNLFNADMTADGVELTLEEGEHELVCRFDTAPLLPRGYSINMSIRSADGREWLMEPVQVAYFQVVANQGKAESKLPGKTHGLLIPHAWEAKRV